MTQTKCVFRDKRCHCQWVGKGRRNRCEKGRFRANWGLVRGPKSLNMGLLRVPENNIGKSGNHKNG